MRFKFLCVVWLVAAACSSSNDGSSDGGIGNQPPDGGAPDGGAPDGGAPDDGANGARILGVSASELTDHVVFGHSTHTAIDRFYVAADPGTQWSVSVTAPWIVASRSATTGDGSVLVTLDASVAGVQLGANTGTILVTNAQDPSNAFAVSVTLDLDLPALIATPNPVVLGGADGRDPTQDAPLDISLGTGSNAWPWTAALVTTDNAAWLQLDQQAGSVGQAPQRLTIHGDRGALVPGRYAGTITLTANVAGQAIEATVDVALNKEGYWLTSTAAGVAFSSFPNRKTLTRTVAILGSQNISSPTLSVTSNQPWLTFTTSSDHPGAALSLTANPAGLALDREYIADVAIGHTSGDIQNTEHIRVGLWVGSRAPVAAFSTPLGGSHVVANPVEPWVYVSNDATRVYAYHVYTGGLVRTIAPAGMQHSGAMAISSDGTHLFVNDDGSKQIFDLDAATGAVLHTYPSSAGATLRYARPSAQPMLLIGDGTVHDLTTGDTYTTGMYGDDLAVDAASRNVYGQNVGSSELGLRAYSLAYTALSSPPLATALRASAAGGSNGQDLCTSLFDGTIYSAAGAPSMFRLYDPIDLSKLSGLSVGVPPSAVACGWNGLIFGAARAGASQTNVWASRGDGTVVSALALHPLARNDVVSHTLALSGDNTRVMALMASSPPDAASFNIIDAPSP